MKLVIAEKPSVAISIISGPAALRCSSFVLKQKEREVTLSLDALPNISKAELVHIIQVEPKKTLKNILKNYLPQRYADFICMEYADTKSNQLNDKTLQSIIAHIKDFRFKVNGSLLGRLFHIQLHSVQICR